MLPWERTLTCVFSHSTAIVIGTPTSNFLCEETCRCRLSNWHCTSWSSANASINCKQLGVGWSDTTCGLTPFDLSSGSVCLWGPASGHRQPNINFCWFTELSRWLVQFRELSLERGTRVYNSETFRVVPAALNISDWWNTATAAVNRFIWFLFIVLWRNNYGEKILGRANRGSSQGLVKLFCREDIQRESDGHLRSESKKKKKKEKKKENDSSHGNTKNWRMLWFLWKVPRHQWKKIPEDFWWNRGVFVSVTEEKPRPTFRNPDHDVKCRHWRIAVDWVQCAL